MATLMPPQTRLSWSLLGLLVGAFIVTDLVGRPAVLTWGALERAGLAAGEWWRVLTRLLLHTDGLHLLINGLALALLLPPVEHGFGPWRTLVVLLGAGLGGALASLVASPVPTVGASGLVFGLLGALLVAPDPPLAKGWLLGAALSSLLVGLPLPHIGTAAHLGGLVGGMLGGTLLCGCHRRMPAGGAR